VGEAAPWIERLARLGFAAKALLYMTVGALAVSAAVGLGSTATPGKHDALFTLLEAPLGRVLIGVMATGLFGYAAWRIIEAVFDPDGHHGMKAVAHRVKSAVTGAIHIMIGITAVKLAIGDFTIGREGDEARHWTARALDTPGGAIALWALASGLIAYGAYQLYNAWRAKLDKRLALGRMKQDTRNLVVALSRFGIAARGVVFIAMGGVLAGAVRDHDPKRAGGLQASLRELVGEIGRWPFAAVAAGLIAYGIYQLINARYRRITVA
jgi:hypothetical protein